MLRKYCFLLFRDDATLLVLGLDTDTYHLEWEGLFVWSKLKKLSLSLHSRTHNKFKADAQILFFKNDNKENKFMEKVFESSHETVWEEILELMKPLRIVQLISLDGEQCLKSSVLVEARFTQKHDCFVASKALSCMQAVALVFVVRLWTTTKSAKKVQWIMSKKHTYMEALFLL